MDHYEGDGVAANSFGRRWLLVAEARALWTAGYPVNNNSKERRRWWSAPGRTLAWVLTYIVEGKDNPPPSRGNDQSSSSRSSARYWPHNTPSPCFLAMVKDELDEAPPTRRLHHGGGGVVIHEWRQSSSPRRFQPVQREWTPPPEYKAAASIVKAADNPDEFLGLRRA
jgi:hypothetical protein